MVFTMKRSLSRNRDALRGVITLFIILCSLSIFAQEKNHKKHPKHCHIEVPDTLNHGEPFKAQSKCDVVSFEMAIYNRFGNEVFKSNNFLDSWATHNDQSGAYFWVLSAQFDDGKEVEEKGMIVLK